MQERVIAKYPIISVHPNMNIEHGIWYFYTHEIFASPFGFCFTTRNTDNRDEKL